MTTLDELVAAFNAGVHTGDWTAYLSAFADDATLEFPGVPAGPFRGRDAIREAYEASPPDDTIEVVGAEDDATDERTVRFRWQRTGATGTMRGRLDGDGRIVRLVVTFD